MSELFWIAVLTWIVVFILRKNRRLIPQQSDNPYAGLREMALQTTPEQLGLAPPTDPNEVYGIVMDWHRTEGTISLVCFSTGDASMYTSTGGGMIGGGGHGAIKIAAREFVQKAKGYLNRSIKMGMTDLPKLPDVNDLQFCFLTTSGIFTAREAFSLIESDKSDWRPLFGQANEVITALRLTES